jgi:hypothetical protein
VPSPFFAKVKLPSLKYVAADVETMVKADKITTDIIIVSVFFRFFIINPQLNLLIMGQIKFAP